MRSELDARPEVGLEREASELRLQLDADHADAGWSAGFVGLLHRVVRTFRAWQREEDPDNRLTAMVERAVGERLSDLEQRVDELEKRVDDPATVRELVAVGVAVLKIVVGAALGAALAGVPVALLSGDPVAGKVIEAAIGGGVGALASELADPVGDRIEDRHRRRGGGD